MAARAEPTADAGAPAPMRLDRFLWHARLTRTRGAAKLLAATGHLRIDGRAVTRASACVRIGNVLTFAAHGGAIRVIRVMALPGRRGPAPEAGACYTDLIAEAHG